MARVEAAVGAPAIALAARPTPLARLWTPLSFLAADLAAVTLASALSVWFWYATGHPLDPAFYAAQWPVLLAFLAAYASAGLYSTLSLHPAEELRRLTVASTLVWISLGAMTFLAKAGVEYSRGVFVLAWLGSLAAVPALRVAIRHACGGRNWWGQAAVIVGGRASAGALAARLLAKPALGLKPVAIAGNASEAETVRRKQGVRWAIVSAADFPERGELAAALGELQRVFAHLIVVPEAAGLPSLRVDAADLDGILGLEIAPRLLRPASVRLKQIFDWTCAALIALAALPVGAAIALAVRAGSPGPAIYGHARRGRGGREFTAWKFRTMVGDAGTVLARHLSEDEEARAEWDATRKLARDPRVTAIGRFLRRTSLDELPQLWNVLRGEMSLVGPRPIVGEEIERYGPQGYALYTRVRPGLTGLWQVSGRNRLPYEERVKLDLFYVTNWSLWLDLYILARTLRAVIRGEGAW